MYLGRKSLKTPLKPLKLQNCCHHNAKDRLGLQQRGEDVAVADDVVVGVNGLVAAGLIVAKDVVVAVAQALAPAELYINVTNDVLVTVS